MTDYNNVDEEVAAAEAALRAAQERLAAAHAKQAAARSSAQASYGSQPYGGAPYGNASYPPPYQNYRQYQPQGQPGSAQAAPQTKDHVAAGLLAIFLGCLGIHKFYLGYNTPGFIMLAVTVVGSVFSLGIAGLVMLVISIVEGVIYLSKTQTEFERTYVFNHKEWF